MQNLFVYRYDLEIMGRYYIRVTMNEAGNKGIWHSEARVSLCRSESIFCLHPYYTNR